MKHTLVNVALDRVQRRIVAKTVVYCREMKMKGNTVATGWVNAALESSVLQFLYATKWQRH